MTVSGLLLLPFITSDRAAVNVCELDNKAPIMLTWGGLRGGLSITYAVVLFSVIGQGLTMERLIRRLYPAEN